MDQIRLLPKEQSDLSTGFLNFQKTTKADGLCCGRRFKGRPEPYLHVLYKYMVASLDS